MNLIEKIFSGLGFDLKSDFESKRIASIEQKSDLHKKLHNSFYFYKAPNQTNTSFYLITILLNSYELNEIRKFIWNENIADLIFYITDDKSRDLGLFFAKASPKLNFKTLTIDSFSTSIEDEVKMANIKKWQFDSGAFWFNYHTFLNKTQHKSIDKVLISTLTTLKAQLSDLLTKNIENPSLRVEIVQALIDRTLYIKYLEDNHIINSYFYTHYFGNERLDYKTLLSSNKKKSLNKLFKIIHKIFNNSLFDKPSIKDDYLTNEVCELLYNSLGTDLETNQLRLFDFQFNVIPVEFISYIYEIFLSEKQKENGIYYTPKKLAQLIVDDVIIEGGVGKVLDPSCGSGMFLIVAFQKLLENSAEKKFKKIEKKIEFRTKLLSENIFGIEKEITAQRFTLFSLSLQLFRGIDPLEIREFISKQLKENKEVSLFSKYSFFGNIVHTNSLSIQDVPFKNKNFDYIVGNPPFFEIKQTYEEISFLNKYELEFGSTIIKAKDIVGKHQISQCFLLKIKDWANKKTRFGFVSNSSNFYNDNSNKFQEFFYSTYNIEKIYELSKVKKILFEKAKESVVALIFSDQNSNDNLIEYYPVDLGVFSEKPFELLIIQEDKSIFIKQSLLNQSVRLRDFLVGNEYDRKLIDLLNKNDKLENYILKNNKGNYFIHRGIDLVGFREAQKEFEISTEKWGRMTTKDQRNYKNQFVKKYSSESENKKFDTPFIKPKDINRFSIKSFSSYLGDISMFHRPRKQEIFTGDRIIWSRIGKSIKAIYYKDKLFFDFDLYVIKLNNNGYYNFIAAILNSQLSDYFINLYLKKRIGSSFPKIGKEDIKKIPIPQKIDQGVLGQISSISEKLKQGENNDELIPRLNELIFELYNLSYLEKQRIRDYFLSKTKITKTGNELEKYKAVLVDTVSMYLRNPIDIIFSKTDFNLIVAKVVLNQKPNTSSADKVKYYMLSEIFEQNPNENFLASQEKIYGRDCVYILKKGINLNWTETKAYEDGKEILKYIVPNGERIHKN